jgi:hypothetical protein
MDCTASYGQHGLHGHLKDGQQQSGVSFSKTRLVLQ